MEEVRDRSREARARARRRRLVRRQRYRFAARRPWRWLDRLAGRPDRIGEAASWLLSRAFRHLGRPTAPPREAVREELAREEASAREARRDLYAGGL